MTPPRRQVRTNLRSERRDPTAATQKLQWLGLGQPQTNRVDAGRSTLTALKAWVVMRCIQIKAQDLAGLPFVAGPRLPVAYTELPQTNPASRLAVLVGQTPAPALSAQVWWEWMLTQRYITGQMASEVEWVDPSRPKATSEKVVGTPGAQVAALWPLTSSALKAVPSEGGASWWKRFEYGRPDQPRKLSPAQVFYGWDPSPEDFRQPYSILHSAGLDVEVAVMVGRYNAAFLRNDARPAAVVVTEQFATEEDYDAFVARFEGRHQGVDNAGRLAFIETDPDGALPSQAVSVQTLGISQKDARMLEMHRASLEHVCMALGVPWSRLSAADRTFSNAGQEAVDYWKSLASDARKFGAEVNASLAPALGGDVGWFDLSGVEALAPRPPVSAGEAAVLVREGIVAAEEVRPWYGLTAELPVGLSLVQSALTQLSAGGADGEARTGDDLPPGGARNGAPIAGPVAPPAALPPGAGDPAHVPDDGGSGLDGGASGARAVDGAGDADTRGLTAEEQETRRATIWRRNDATLRGLEAAYTKRWAAYFNRQATVVIDQLTAKRTATRLDAATRARELRTDVPLGGPLDPNEIARWRAQAQDLADLMHTAATTSGVQRINHAFGVSFDLEAPFIQDFIAARANQLAGTVTDTTYAAVQQALADGVANGASIDDLAAAVRQVFDVASTSRAKTIARTEVISAANGSASLAATQLPGDVAAGQEWISTRDERTRDDHADADGQVVTIGTPFEVGGEPLAYPGDPGGDGGNVINCRCTVAFLTPQDMEGRSRRVSFAAARTALRLLEVGGPFDETRFRRALEAA